jgi:hypothetical protein
VNGEGLAALGAFVTRNRGAGPVREAFPFQDLESCAGARALPDDAFETLVALLDIAMRYDDAVDGRGRNCYEGNDLRRQAAVVSVIGKCAGRRAAVDALVVGLFDSVMRTSYFSTPGSPDIDKYDRDLEVERSEDALARACVKVLAALDPLSHGARAALRAARGHRDDEVRGVAISVRSAAPFVESALSRLYDRFGALPTDDWVGRLLGPDQVTALAACNADEPRVLGWAAWGALVLPECVLHPGCLLHPARPIETLLGIESEQALALAYGGGDEHARDRVVTDPGRSALARGTRLSLVELEEHVGSDVQTVRGAPALRVLLDAVDATSSPPAREELLRAFGARGTRPAWMCLEVVPVPGSVLDDGEIRACSSMLLDRARKQRRAVEIAAPEPVLFGAQVATQRAFDALFVATCRALDTIARSGAG